MFLKRLETVGFKSFAERTTIEFVPGVTAVVGPNGSGKSNIIDAIRWVLGEQSAKSLRGQKMEDIIFQGSDTRNPLNFAEVSLVLHNEDNELPIDYHEVNVTRRVYRSGESEFFINKQSCRLKDIVDLFMDTGLGRESFSIIGQGRIDEILSSKAEERRAIFEEAAGVLKYKQRKHKAEFKLKETADNLDRVEDIIHEIEQQIEPLQEQAATALKYKEKKGHLEKVEIALLVTEIEHLHTEWQELLHKIEEEKLLEIKEKTAIQEREANVTKDRHYLEELDQQITTLQNKLLTATEQLEKYEGKRNVLIERSKHMQENKQKLVHEQHVLGERLAQTKTSLTTEREQLKHVTETVQQVKTQIKQLENKLFHGLDAVKEEIEDLKSDYIEYLNEQAVLQNELQSTEKQLTQIDGQKQQQSDSHKSFLEEEENFLQEKQQIDEKIQMNHEKVQKQEDYITELKEHLASERNQYDVMQQKLYEGNEHIAKLTSRKEMLVEMKETFQGFFYGVKEILQASKENRLQDIEGAVLDLIQVPTKYMTAVDTILGAQAQYVVVSNDMVARNVIHWLKKENKGRATFLPLQSIETRTIPDHLIRTVEQHEGFLGIAANIVQTDKKYDKVKEHLMGNVIITDTLQHANEIAQKTNRRFRVVTLDGDVVNPGGSMSGGAKKKTNQSLFSREKEITLLEEKLHEFEMRRNDFSTKVNKQREKIMQLEHEVTKAEQDLQQCKNNLEIVQANESELAIKLRRAKDNLTTYHVGMEQLEEDRARYKKQKESIVKRLETMNTKIMNTEQTIERLTYEEQTVKDNEKNTEKQLHELQITVAEREERRKNHLHRIDGLQEQCNQLEAENNEITEQMEEIKQLEQSANREDELGEQIEKYKQLRHDTMMKIEQLRAERKKKMQLTDDEETEIRGLYKNHEKFVQTIQEKEVQANRLDVALENRLSLLQTEYVMTYEKAAEMYDKVENIERAKAEVKTIKRSIDQLGTVNIGAIEEYERIKERYTFLSEQQNDLIAAKNTLHTVIREMDEEMTARFSTMFVQIQSSFTTVFKQLFGGGHAELTLTDPNNLLETGIEIVARPPGKKLRSLGLLSGGERALTAIALLFAILRARPVPFCILDEVDAALDEANVVRFGNYLKTFSEESQFIVITHRKGTMEEADALYGVTMQELGVSRLVSVRLEDTSDLVEST